MRKPTNPPKAGNRTYALMAALPIAAILLPASDLTIRERHVAMFEVIAASEPQAQPHGRTTPGARDPAVAVEEEYQLARQRGTAEALELFIARHPDSPLAEKARAELRRKTR